MKRTTKIIIFSLVMAGIFSAVLISQYNSSRNDTVVVTPAVDVVTDYQVAQSIVNDMKNNPTSWTGDYYSVTNGKLCIWIANGAGGIGVRNSGRRCWPNDGDLSAEARTLIWNTIQTELMPNIKARNLKKLIDAVR